MSEEVKMPVQPVEIVGKTIKFRKNKIVRWLLDEGPFDMDVISMIPGVTDDEKTQFAQLIGYSVYGAAMLPYFDKKALAKTLKASKKLVERK